jgi:isopentenyldiphosphate isomerase
MADSRKLNIVDEEGKIIGTDTRENIHKKGLLHREIHVWFYTPNGELIFQHRAKDKDTYPDLLDVTVGGHVEIGDDYEDAMVKEVLEETGLSFDINEFQFLQRIKYKYFDPVTKMTNYAIAVDYAIKYIGDVKDLKIEKGKSLGFESWSFDKVFNLAPKEKIHFIPALLEDEFLSLYKKIQKIYETT